MVKEEEDEIFTDGWLKDWTEEDVVKREVQDEPIASQMTEEECDSPTKCNPASKSHLSEKEYDSEGKRVLQDFLERCTETTRSSSGLVKFKCPGCHYRCGSWDRVKIHSKSCTGSHLGRKRGDVVSYIEKVVAHICQICGKRILCDTRFIANHVIRNHGLKLSEYRIRLGDGHENGLDLRAKVIEQAQEESEKIGNLCTYQCNSCERLFQSELVLRRHWLKEREHRTRGSGNLLRSIVRAVKYMCHICHEWLLCDHGDISRHAKSRHSLSLADFCDKVGEFAIKRYTSQLAKSQGGLENIGNFCTFSCNICDFTCQSWNCMTKHLKKLSHGVPTTKEIMKYLNTINLHKCKICEEAILCDNFFIGRHVRRHMMKSSVKYGSQHTKILKEYCKISGCKDMKPQRQTDKLFENAPVSKILGNLCSFRCSTCHKVFASYCNLRAHTRRGQNCFQTLQKVERFLVTLRAYQCHICNKKTLCDNYFIKEHLRVHGMKRKDVLKQYQTKELKQLKLESFVKDIPTYQPQDKAKLDANTIPKKFLTIHLGNLCEFACTDCDLETSSWGSLQSHFYKKHNRKMGFSPQNVIVARYHKCLLCNSIILCDNRLVSDHVKSRHNKMTPLQYHKIVRQNGGKVLSRFDNSIIDCIESDTTKFGDVKLTKPCKVVCHRLPLSP